MAGPLRGIVRGDVPLARVIFEDARYRKLIPQLQAEGWPIFDLAGKRCGYPAKLKAHARRVQQRRHRRAARDSTDETATVG